MTVTAAQGDQRSPDARAAGRSDALPTLGPPTWPENPVPLTSDEPNVTVAAGPASEFEWTDAAVGAAVALGLVVVLAGTVALVSRTPPRHAGTCRSVLIEERAEAVVEAPPPPRIAAATVLPARLPGALS